MVLACLLLAACAKAPGEGGTSSIAGRVYVEDYNGQCQLTKAFYGPEVDVYIIYGDGNVYDDSFETSYDGGYEFRYLRKGTYTVFAYSECECDPDCDTDVKAIKKTVEITGRNQVVEAPDIVVIK